MKKAIKYMKIVLIKEVPNLGKIGEVVQVKQGFARNFLLPRKLAALPGSTQAREILLEVKQKKTQKLKRTEEKKEKSKIQEKKRQAMAERKAKLLQKKTKKVV